MPRPVAVCISDIHFNLNTLPLAAHSLTTALLKAESLDIPLVIAGDLNDSKAIIRAEVANSIISILKYSKVKVYILVGNHDLINEKGQEHGLTYLSPFATIVDKITKFNNFTLIPYFNSSENLIEELKAIPHGELLIMHQGFLGAQMGDYIQDKTSISPEVVQNYKVISGHYHRHQTISTVTYIGNPFTLSFGEANDGPKGFLILNSDGSFTRELLSLRKHVIIHRNINNLHVLDKDLNAEDCLWLKIEGPLSELQKLNKAELGFTFIGHTNFKLDLVPLNELQTVSPPSNISPPDLLDQLIDGLNESPEYKIYLKGLHREIT